MILRMARPGPWRGTGGSGPLYSTQCHSSKLKPMPLDHLAQSAIPPAAPLYLLTAQHYSNTEIILLILLIPITEH